MKEIYQALSHYVFTIRRSTLNQPLFPARGNFNCSSQLRLLIGHWDNTAVAEHLCTHISVLLMYQGSNPGNTPPFAKYKNKKLKKLTTSIDQDDSAQSRFAIFFMWRKKKEKKKRKSPDQYKTLRK